MLQRCKHEPTYKNIEVLVSREEFIPWFMERDFEGASVDRIDNKGDYKLSNMQVIHHRINGYKDKVGVPSTKRKDIGGNRECSSCKIVKPFKEYPKNKSRWNGYSHYCKACNRLRFKEYYAKKKASI